MNQFGKRISRRTALLTLAAAGAVTVTGRQVTLLSADPVGDEECHPQPLTESNLTAPPEAASTRSLEQLPWAQEGGYINDASCLNRTPVHGIVQVRTEEDIHNALAFAQENGKPVTIAGVRHSMGGHAFYNDAVVLDMRAFNAITLDAEAMTVTVQSGATWHDIQNLLHPTYAVKAMQSTDIFTVGGSIAVNAHGMDHQVGSVARTIRALRVMLTDGTVLTVSPTENSELFSLVVGGYGLFGIVLAATLEITHNAIYQTSRRVIDYRDFPTVFADELATNPRLGLMYNHLSTAPQSLLRSAALSLRRARCPRRRDSSTARSGNQIAPLCTKFFQAGRSPMRMKWFQEKRIEPMLESCSVTSQPGDEGW
ncbi:MAG: FAD-binding oxidoreductase [Caldilineaceae bacterium]